MPGPCPRLARSLELATRLGPLGLSFHIRSMGGLEDSQALDPSNPDAQSGSQAQPADQRPADHVMEDPEPMLGGCPEGLDFRITISSQEQRLRSWGRSFDARPSYKHPALRTTLRELSPPSESLGPGSTQ